MQNLKNKLGICTQKYIENANNITRNPDPRRGRATQTRNKRNLTEQEEAALANLRKKTESLEMVILETDKTKRFSCDSSNNYKLLGEEHVANDRTIDQKTKDEYEKLINAHSEMWLRIINAGKDHNQYNRIKHSMMSKNCPPAPLSLPRKDHKIYESEEIGPPGRPVGGGDVTYNRRISHLISMILMEVYKEKETVCSSTEEMLASVDMVNRRGIDSTYIIGSADVKALYPSLEIDFTIEKVCELFNRSNVNIKHINYKEIALYIALNSTEEEISNKRIDGICPKRRYTRGPRPNITGCGTREDEKERYEPWVFPEESNINEDEKRKLIVEAIRIVLDVILKTHTYKFNGITKVQTSGGPIGMEITGVIAQIFMVWWDERLKQIAEDIGLEIILYERYVDDINVIMKRTEKGQRYEGEELIQNEETKRDDEGIMEDERTMKVFKTIGESIHTSIKLEIDYTSKHEDNKVTILDLKLWIAETEDGTKILYEHYEKKIASKAVINARSSMPMQTKRTVLTQEILRILRHCSPYLSWDRVCIHINNYMKKLQFSGYNKNFRYDVINSALKAFEIIKQNANEGVRPINRPKQWKREERRIERETKKKRWYKTGGFNSVMFIPATPTGELKKMYQEEIKKSGFKIKVIEKAGTSLKRILQKSDPFRNKFCDRDDCLQCTSGGKGNCDVESINYNIKCTELMCQQRNIYEGETSYNSYTRGREHNQKLNAKDEKSALWRHCREIHNGTKQKFIMNTSGSFKDDSLKRQISESVNINSIPIEQIMNTRNEWNNQRIPHVTIVNL